jgi:hypothetical protein
MKYFALLLLLPSVASASDYCFCKPVVQNKVYQKAVVRQPQIINRIVGLQSPEEPKIDPEGIIAEARALELALQAIPGIDQDLQAPQWRQFRFDQNTGAYQAPAALRQQVVATQAVTKRYVGVVDISYRIKPDGTVDFQVDGEQNPQQQYGQQQSSGYGY